MPENGAGVIDPDVLWSCVTCGACVEQCPVDIEHVDHIVDMRRYQVLVESNFPAELNGLFKGLENKGNPWNMSATARMDWAKDLPFDVKVVGKDVESLDEVEWLFWVGCAGAYEDRAKKTTRAVAELLDMAGVDFAVLGNGETCNGDSARRAGNEFVFQGLAQQNIETFKEYKVKKVVSTCAHCFNTLKNEYRDLGYEMEVVHHTQLLNRLVREKKLTPVALPRHQGPHKRAITYHDPCYIGRHNGVYAPPRELLNVIPDAELKEMPRNSERSFCCGAGGARMWMEETIGSRINETRTAEAVATGADQIAVGCPFCRVMLSDGLTSQQANGDAREEVEVLDVAQLLLASVKGESKPSSKSAAKAGAPEAKSGDAGGGTAVLTKEADSQGGQRGHQGRARGRGRDPDRGDRQQDRGRGRCREGIVRDVVRRRLTVRHRRRRRGVGRQLSRRGSARERGRPSPGRSRRGAPELGEDRQRGGQGRGPSPGDEGFGGGSLFDLGGDDSSTSEEPAAEPKVEETGGEVDRSEDDADADVTPEGETEAVTKSEPDRKSEDAPASRWGGLHPGHRDPRGRLPVRHRRTRGVRTRSQVRAGPGGRHRRGPTPTPSTVRRRVRAGGSTAKTPAGDSTTDADVDRSQDDADGRRDTRERDRAGGRATEDKAEAKEAPATGGATSTPGTEIPEGGSLFDIAEPEESAPAAKSEPAAGGRHRRGPCR